MKREQIDVRLPAETVRELAAIAKLAGVSVNTVIQIAIAYELRREQRAAEPKA